ncbi:hypothetical protein [Azohydromonas caseinilytica]|uniref:Uncharacterized protein n=1 Tax=Azohydromonas caseinilytica TaxID=2728836 RepID=A0A848FLK0_9BURK|nr:hypothetical protein [Azohydromonas caseinilytica]NML19093.1 hypothetical protein [Azohydromonas caseinilytica]
MDKIEQRHLGLSLFAGVMLALALGMATHWSMGLLLFLAWLAVHGLTWGFAGAIAKPDDRRKPE